MAHMHLVTIKPKKKSGYNSPQNQFMRAMRMVKSYLTIVHKIDCKGKKDKELIIIFSKKKELTINCRHSDWIIDYHKSMKSPKIPNLENYSFYSSKEWLILRKKVLIVHGRCCLKCGSRTEIQVDHIKPRSKFPSLSLDFDNLQVLCKKCNFKKSNIHFTDYRIKKSPND